MYNEERMKEITQKMNMKRDADENRYVDALKEINKAYNEIPEFARKTTISFGIECECVVSIYTINRNGAAVSRLEVSDRTGSSSIVFSTGGSTNYKKLSLAASKAVENARSIRPGLEWVLTHTDEFIGAMMEHLEKEYC